MFLWDVMTKTIQKQEVPVGIQILGYTAILLTLLAIIIESILLQGTFP